MWNLFIRRVDLKTSPPKNELTIWIKNPYYHEYVVSIFAPITMEDLRYSPRENAKKKMDLNSHHNKTC